MRNPRTLFIIGAGASHEAGLPLGAELIEIVASKLNFRIEHGSLREDSGARDILDVFQQLTQTRDGMQALIDAASRVRDGVIFSKSIDSFIDVHRDNKNIQLCGKLAIAKTILDSERTSHLYVANTNSGFKNTDALKTVGILSFLNT
jgi:hypothetical protein